MKRFICNANGQGIMEYVIISSLVGIICLAAMKNFGEVINTRVEKMSAKITQHIKV